jgi:hypothetical protein
MSNRHRSPVSYRKLSIDPLVSEGLLSVARDDGRFERRAQEGFESLASQAGRFADRAAQIEGAQAGERDAMARAGSPVPQLADQARPATAFKAGAQGAAGDVISFFKDRGFSDVAAAAIAGNLQQESGFNTRASGDQGTAFGLFQHRLDRLDKLRRFAQQMGKSEDDPIAQMAFAAHELNTTESRAGKALKEATSPQEAVDAMMHFFRPAGYSSNNPRGGHGYMNRLQNTLVYLGQAQKVQAQQKELVEAERREKKDGVPVPPELKSPYTLRGQAYNKAFTRTMLANLQTDLMVNAKNVYEAYADDPATLNDAYQQLYQESMQSVPDEIKAEYDQAFAQQSSSYLLKSQENAQRRFEDQETASFLQRVNDLETDFAQRLNDIDPDNPLLDGALSDMQGALEANIDDAVERGLITATQGVARKSQSRRNVAIGFYAKQAEGKSLQELVDYREQIKKDFSNNALSGVDGEAFQAIGQRLNKAISMRIDDIDEQEMQQEQLIKEREQAITSRGYDLLIDGALSLDWIDRNRDNLSLADYRRFSSAVSSDSQNTNSTVYSILMEQAYQDPDRAREAALEAHSNQEITREAFQRIVTIAGQNIEYGFYGNSPQSRAASALKDRLAILSSLPDSEYDIIQAYDDFATMAFTDEEGRVQPPKFDIHSLSDEALGKHVTRKIGELPLSSYGPQTRGAISLDTLKQAVIKLRQDMDENLISEEQFTDELKKINDWIKVINAN